ncbi:MAG: hypothetical protein A3E21_07265 [Sulfurimonas sp. RIFCSPHIGHO2_12_FULL_36_9]|uniref:hypothetical protein n=1 Tax=Sulfurimonas sp. RIFCSPLOWO2_12_36_12 TaxID=1802253 RepID=UPI0008CC135E|nr:hypothetical protein [Sulfurimonas sp. RIFCSPLOWO2_12_36_12]OHD97106.1 MAG: hypothetical protein A3E21_07265 [Sulfurimonas sp. RIFCSPHIGHO2_12_FULL_36_9]OHD97611.1 MAG: hypothetical protein A3J26_04970 [Sulfurimonas sp. RIFCSPLOWO2_02_FULL_36_28]OHE00827.1 MAG: hypothetical protein A2W82_11155 [Sulfurimonas sp. RIFCSPLOWO2_12_36_12]OHE08568.1 MAG: hypothetical protein A3K14_03665 [Sulfurimonas sp. RIFCSPLOWO2_12_FULL_36_74]
MSLIPADASKIDVAGATVDFFKLEKDGQSTYYFDTSKCGPPEPMVNAVSGLKLIKGTNDKLVMINHKTPGGLFAKLQDDISHEIEETPSGLVKVVFSSNNSSSADTNLQNISH